MSSVKEKILSVKKLKNRFGDFNKEMQQYILEFYYGKK